MRRRIDRGWVVKLGGIRYGFIGVIDVFMGFVVSLLYLDGECLMCRFVGYVFI